MTFWRFTNRIIIIIIVSNKPGVSMSMSMSMSYTLLNVKFSEECVGLCEEMGLQPISAGADPAIGEPGGRLPLRAWLCAFTV